MQRPPPPEAVAALFSHPLFDNLEDETDGLLLRVARHHYLEPGHVLTEEGDAASQLFVLVKGEIAITNDDRFTALIEAPQVVGLIALLDGARRSATIEAFTPAEIFVISREDFEDLMAISVVLDNNLIRWMAQETRRLYRKHEQLRRHFDDFFKTPNAQLVPGPYAAEPFDFHVFLMQDDPARLERLLPDGLVPLPGAAGLYLVSFSFFERVGTTHPDGAGKVFAYDEMAPFVPALGPRLRAGLFCPELYPDNCLAMTLGRELYGFPKRFGDIEREGRRIDLVMGGRMTLRARWQGEKPLSPREFIAGLTERFTGDSLVGRAAGQVAGAFFELLNTAQARRHWPAMPVFVRKLIPDAASDRTAVMQIDELVEVPFEVTHLADFTELTAPQVRVLDRDWFLGGTCVGAWRLRMGFAFGRGKVLVDNLETPARTGFFDRWLK